MVVKKFNARPAEISIKMLNLLFRNLGRIRCKINKTSLSNPNCLVCFVSFWESDFDGLNLYDALRDLVPFVQFKKREIHPRKSVTFSKVAGWSHGCFSRFLNCTNCTKLRNASFLLFPFHSFWNTGFPHV